MVLLHNGRLIENRDSGDDLIYLGQSEKWNEEFQFKRNVGYVQRKHQFLKIKHRTYSIVLLVMIG